MKSIQFIFFFALFGIQIIAQNGQTLSFDLKNPDDLKKIKIVSAQNFDVVHVHINDMFYQEAPFIAASIRLEGQRLDDNIVVNIHAKDDNKNTVNYTQLHHFHESDADPTQVFVSELGFLDKSTNDIQFVFKLEKPALSKLNKIHIRLFNPTNLPPAKATSFAPEGACDVPPSVSRAVWGGNLALQNNVIYKGTPSFAPVTHLIVHHSAGQNTSTNWTATVASIFDYHVNSNGWSDVGYNYLITPDGALYYGRGGGNNVIGAHYCAKNTNTMGVCMVGNYMTVAPTDTAWRTLERLFAWKAVESNINPTALANLSDLGSIPVVNGHRSGCATECPGDSSFNRLPALRTRLSAIVTACRAVSTHDLSQISDISLSPNPVLNGKILLKMTLQTPQDIAVKAYDALGRQVFGQTFGENTGLFSTELDISALTHGVYFFYIYAGKSFTTQKIVVE
jgi:N-acetylmuramoyl-L-alanine amidase/Secretion system C-terminal sorting domain